MGRRFCIRTAPIPRPKESHSITNSCVKSGNARTRNEAKHCLSREKTLSCSLPQRNPISLLMPSMTWPFYHNHGWIFCSTLQDPKIHEFLWWRLEWATPNCANLQRIHLDSCCRDDMAQVIDGSKAKWALLSIHHKGVKGQYWKNFIQVW